MTNDPRHAAGCIVNTLRRAGYEAYLAGGCVRDLLLNLQPEDCDVATNAGPDDVASLFENTSTVGRQFAVVHVRTDDTVVEVATFRRDLGYSDGRHPDAVARTDARGDAMRRDFTINGMFLDPETDQIIDYVGGRDDLRKKLVRAIGDPLQRFVEDRLRLIRAVRLAARLHFSIDPHTADAIRSQATSLVEVSPERLAVELKKGLLDPSRAGFVRLLDETLLLPVVLPEVSGMKGVLQSSMYHPEGDVFEHTLALLDKLDTRSWPLVLAGLLHDAGKVVAQKENPGGEFYRHEQHGAELVVKVAARLKLSNATRDRASWLVRKHMALLNVREMRLSTLRRLFVEEGFHELLALARADTLASDGDLSWYDFCTRRYDDLSRTQLKPKRLISGDDLIELGLRPGPIFAGLLEEAYDQQLGGDTTTKAEGIAFIKERLRRRPQEKRGRTASDS